MVPLLAQESLTKPADDLLQLAVHYWGPAGLIIVALAIVCIYLYKRVEKIQDLRIAESKENAEKNAALVRDLDNTVRDLTHAVSSLRDTFLMSKAGG